MPLSNINIQYAIDAGDEITVFDKDLTIHLWNSKCQSKYGFSPEEAVGKNLLELFPFIKNDYRVQCLKDAVQNGETFFFHGIPYSFSTGHYSQYIHPLRRNKEVIGVLNVVRPHDGTRIFTKEDLLKDCLKG